MMCSQSANRRIVASKSYQIVLPIQGRFARIESYSLEASSDAKEDARTVVVDFVKVVLDIGELLLWFAEQVDRIHLKTEMVVDLVGRARLPDPDIADIAQACAVANEWLEVAIAILVVRLQVPVADLVIDLRAQGVLR